MSDIHVLYNALCDNNIPIPKCGFNAFGICRWGKNYRYWAIDLNGTGFVFGDWSIGNSKCFAFDNATKQKMTPSQRKALDKIIKERFEQEQKRREQHQENMSKIATMACVGNNGKPINHPYLTKKQIICPNDITFDREQNALLIPVSDLNGKIWGYQTIFSDGQKHFLKGARKKGCMYCFGDITSADKIFVCEGFATGASLYDATNITTIVAFDAGNIDFVVGEIIRKYPQKRIIIAADNDIGKTQNTGAETAKSVVNKYHISAILPDKLTAGMSDWNDIACKYGKNEIIKQLTKGGIL